MAADFLAAALAEEEVAVGKTAPFYKADFRKVACKIVGYFFVAKSITILIFLLFCD